MEQPEIGKTVDMSAASAHYPTSIPLTRIKLVGASNYLVWAKQSLMNLKARGVYKYVSEEVKKPDIVEGSKWDSDNNVVSLLLTNVMDDAILPQFILYESAKEIWDAASFMYSQKENKAQAFELQTRAWNLRQGDLSVTDYYNEFSKIWQQIDFVMPCVTKCSECAGIVSKRENQIRAYKFLDGLNSEFDQIRQ
jgi:Retrotransposon gag protein